MQPPSDASGPVTQGTGLLRLKAAASFQQRPALQRRRGLALGSRRLARGQPRAVPPPRRGGGRCGPRRVLLIWVTLKFYSSIRKGGGGIFLCMKQKWIRCWTGLELKIIWVNWGNGLEEAVSRSLGEWKVLRCSSNTAPQGLSIGLTSSSSGKGSNAECKSAMSRC